MGHGDEKLVERSPDRRSSDSHWVIDSVGALVREAFEVKGPMGQPLGVIVVTGNFEEMVHGVSLFTDEDVKFTS